MASGSAPAQDAFAALLRKQDLVVSRGQALERGLTLAKINYRTRRGGPWQRLLPGVYLTATGTPTSAQQEIAALLYAGAGSVITGSGPCAVMGCE